MGDFKFSRIKKGKARRIFQVAQSDLRSPLSEGNGYRRARDVFSNKQILDIFGGALAIRFVDAGSCNGCELEIHAVNNPYYNLEGLGIKFVASPRHADMLLVTGPVSRNMELALR